MARKKKHGGSRKGAGRPPRPSLAWPEEFDFATKKNWAGFLKHLTKVTYEDKLSERATSAINNTMRLFAEAQGWIVKAPLQIIQAQTVVKADVQKMIEVLEPDEQIVFARAIKRLERLQDQPGGR